MFSFLPDFYEGMMECGFDSREVEGGLQKRYLNPGE